MAKRLSDAGKIKLQQEKNLKAAERAVLKLKPKMVDGKPMGRKRRIPNTKINVMVTADGRYYIYPYPNLDAIDAITMIAGAPALEVFQPDVNPEYLKA